MDIFGRKRRELEEKIRSLESALAKEQEDREYARNQRDNFEEQLKRERASHADTSQKVQALEARAVYPSLYALATKKEGVSSRRFIRDAVWGDIYYPEYVHSTINHPAFRRLRRVRQNGLLHLVFPSGNHSRFEHSLGAYHVTRLLMRSLAASSINNFPFVNDEEVRTLLAAALLHDIGHFPYAHQLETARESYLERRLSPDEEELIAQRRSAIGSDPTPADLAALQAHEEQLRHVVIVSDEERAIPVLSLPEHYRAWSEPNKEVSLDDVLRAPMPNGWAISRPERVGKIVTGDPGEDLTKYTFFWRGLIQPDQIDYLLRDSRSTGVGYAGIDFHRVRNCVYYAPGTPIARTGAGGGVAQVGPRPVMKAKGIAAVESILFLRYLMYRHIYYHKTVAAAHQMLRRAVYVALSNSLISIDEIYHSHDRAGSSEAALIERLAALEGTANEAVEVRTLAGCILDRHLHRRVCALSLGEDVPLYEIATELAADPKLVLKVEDKLAEMLALRSGDIVIDVPPRKQLYQGLFGVSPGALYVHEDGVETLTDFSAYHISALHPLYAETQPGVTPAGRYFQIRVFAARDAHCEMAVAAEKVRERFEDIARGVTGRPNRSSTATV